MSNEIINVIFLKPWKNGRVKVGYGAKMTRDKLKELEKDGIAKEFRGAFKEGVNLLEFQEAAKKEIELRAKLKKNKEQKAEAKKTEKAKGTKLITE